MAAPPCPKFGGIAQAEGEAPAETGAASRKHKAFVDRRRTNRCQVVFVNGVDDRVTNALAAQRLHLRADRRCATVHGVEADEANLMPRLTL